MSLVLFFIYSALTFNVCICYKFLLVSPLPSRSHAILGEGYIRILLEAGHEVTYITSYRANNTHPKLRQIELTTIEGYFIEQQDLGLSNDSWLRIVYHNFNLLSGMAYYAINEEDVQKLLLDETERFDAVIAEWLYSEYYAGFSAVFQCPLIWTIPIHPLTMDLFIFGDLSNPVYTSNLYSASDAPDSFVERWSRLGMFLFEQFLKWNSYNTERRNYEEAFGPAAVKRGQVLPPYSDAKYNGSIVLSNSHVSLGHSPGMTLNYKQIAGFHIPEKVPKLPEYLQKVMDTAKYGVIYFSMGSIFKGTELDEQTKKGLLDVFGTLKQTVIWKFEEVRSDLPKNVHIVKWVPQHGILAHPNCRLFITHGGQLSSIEALHFGVPILGIPSFCDQFANVNRAVRKGYGRQYAFSDGPKYLKEILDEMINNPRYRQKAKELSFVFHHRPVPPAKEVLHWIEHVVLTGGAPHLRPVGRGVPLYQKLYLDLVALIIVTVVVLLFGFKSITKAFNVKKSIYPSDKKNI